MNYQEIASKWRSAQTDSLADTGIVLIWDNQVYGWKDKLRNPECERPGAIAVDIDGNVFRAEGGDDHNGATRWSACAGFGSYAGCGFWQIEKREAGRETPSVGT